MLTVYYTRQFKTELKKVRDKSSVGEVIKMLACGEALPAKYRPHRLSGNYAECMECHVKPDLLLIYKIDNEVLILTLLRIGSHSALFK